MKCVKSCEYMGVVADGHICKFHQVSIEEDKYGNVLRCRQCERHAYYNEFVNEMSGVVDTYNSFVCEMDEKMDNVHFLMDRVKDKI